MHREHIERFLFYYLYEENDELYYMFIGYNVASNSCSTTGENMSFKNTWLFSLPIAH